MEGKYIFHAAMGVVLLTGFAGIGSLFWTRGLGMVDYRAAQVEAGQPGGYRGPPLPAGATNIRIRQSGWRDEYLLLTFRAPAQQIDSFAWRVNAQLQPGIRLPSPDQFIHAAMLDDPRDSFQGIRRVRQGRSYLKTYKSSSDTWHGRCVVTNDATGTLYYMAW